MNEVNRKSIGRCPTCGDARPLREDGKIAAHPARSGACSGEGQFPTSTAMRILEPTLLVFRAPEFRVPHLEEVLGMQARLANERPHLRQIPVRPVEHA